MEFSDIAYGSHERQKVDIFIPPNPKSDSGLILFIHGGGWHDGDKKMHHHDCRHFYGLGYICAAMNYRFVTEELSVFDELDDITYALKKVKEKCAENGYNISRLILSGKSAGGHLSLMYAYKNKHKAPITPVAACVHCPPVNCAGNDFLFSISGEFEDWKYELLSKCCGYKLTKDTFLNKDEQAALRRISPEEYVSEECVPTAIFHGRHDDLVPIDHTFKLIDSLNKLKIKNDLIVYENSGHVLDQDPEAAEKANNIMKSYCETYL